MNFLWEQPHHNKLVIIVALAVWLGMGIFTVQRVFADQETSDLMISVYGQSGPVLPGQKTGQYKFSALGDNERYYNKAMTFELEWVEAAPPGFTNNSYLWSGDTHGLVDGEHFDDSGLVNTDLYMTVPTTTPGGSYAFIITAHSQGFQSRAVPFTLVVQDFTVSALPLNATVQQGRSADFTVTVGGLQGFRGTIDLSVTGLPSGATVSWPQGSSGTLSTGITSFAKTLSVVPQAGAALDTPYSFTVQGVSGSLTHTANASYTVTSGTATYSISLPDGNIAPIWTGQTTSEYKLRVMSKTGFTGGTVVLDLGWTGATPSGAALNWEGGTNTVTFPANPPENTYVDKKFSITTTEYDPQSGNGTAGATYPFQITGRHDPDPPVVFSNQYTYLQVGDWSLTVNPSSVSVYYRCEEIWCAPVFRFASQKTPLNFRGRPTLRWPLRMFQKICA